MQNTNEETEQNDEDEDEKGAAEHMRRRSIAHEEGNIDKMKENAGIEMVKYQAT